MTNTFLNDSAAPPASKNIRRAFFVFVILYGLLCLVSNLLVNFHQTHNDFWDVYFVARHMTTADVQTWFNPQYPVGSCLFLKLIMRHFSPEIPGILTNILFGFIILTLSFMLYRKVMEPTTALVTVLALGLFPRLFHYINLAGGDPAAVAFFTAGAFLVLKQCIADEKKQGALFFLAGILLGFGALFRYHVLVGSLFFLASCAVLYRQHWKVFMLAGAGLVCGYIPQIIVNLVTGHGVLQTQFGMMNVYDLMYGFSWHQTLTFKLPHSIPALIAHDPLLFFRKYLVAFILLAPAYLPAVLAFFSVKNPLQKKMCTAIALWTLVYCGFFAATTSGRAILLPLPLSFLCAGLWVKALADSFMTKKKVRVGVPILVGLLVFGFFAKDILFTIGRYREHKVCAAIETYLRQNGCTQPQQLYSTDFMLYFRSMPPYMTYFNGGAPRWGTYLYNDEYPEFPVNSLDAFYAECLKRRVRFVLLNKESALLSPKLGNLYDGTAVYEGITFMKKIDRIKIFEVTFTGNIIDTASTSWFCEAFSNVYCLRRLC